MKRSRSPLSENTIAKVVEESSESNVSSDDSFEESSSFVDDSDADPHYDPQGNIPGPSAMSSTHRYTLGVSRPSISSSDTDDADESITNVSTPRPRGRPRTTHVNRPRPNESDDDNDEWEEVNEDNDPGNFHPFSFQEVPGVKHCPPRNSAVICYFKLFFTQYLLEMIVKFTNMYAERSVTAHNLGRPCNKAISWKKVTIEEIQAFITVLINMGINKKPTIASYWWTNPNQISPYFAKMFARNRFQEILRYIHIVDTVNLPKPREPNYDPCARVKPLIEHANRVSRHLYNPGQYLSIDESMVPTKAHNPLMQYMPNKHHRFGIKLWMLCDAVTHYCLAFFVYRGAKGPEAQEVKENGLGYTVVMKLLEFGGYLQKGYHIFVDNFFTSLKLAKKLYDNLTFITGTMRKNRKGIPAALIKEPYTVGEKKYRRKGNMVMLGYRQRATHKNPVLLLSTNASVSNQQRSKKRGNKVYITSKPAVIRQYNDYMGGLMLMTRCFTNI